MKRHDAREAVFKMIYESQFREGDESGAEASEETYSRLLETLEIGDDPYIRTVYFGVLENKSGLDEKIEGAAVGWKKERLSKVSLAIMRLCVYEMLYVEDVPPAAAMNEAVELAKLYDDDTAPSFINGVVNKIAENEGLKEAK